MKLVTLAIYLSVISLCFSASSNRSTKAKDLIVPSVPVPVVYTGDISVVVPFYKPWSLYTYPYLYDYGFFFDIYTPATIIPLIRKDANNNTKSQPSLSKVEKELKELKKNVFGSADFNTEKIRAEKSAFDADWLAKQAKITRALQLEDYIKNRKSKGEEDEAEEAPKKDAGAKLSEAASVPQPPKEAAPAKTRRTAVRDDEEEEQDEKKEKEVLAEDTKKAKEEKKENKPVAKKESKTQDTKPKVELKRRAKRVRRDEDEEEEQDDSSSSKEKLDESKPFSGMESKIAKAEKKEAKPATKKEAKTPDAKPNTEGLLRK
jgi:hypothetical protein